MGSIKMQILCHQIILSQFTIKFHEKRFLICPVWTGYIQLVCQFYFLKQLKVASSLTTCLPQNVPKCVMIWPHNIIFLKSSYLSWRKQTGSIYTNPLVLIIPLHSSSSAHSTGPHPHTLLVHIITIRHIFIAGCRFTSYALFGDKSKLYCDKNQQRVYKCDMNNI